MTPIVDGLEVKLSEQINVERLNAAEPENQKLMQEFGVRGHPIQQTFFGPQEEETLRAALTALLDDPE